MKRQYEKGLPSKGKTRKIGGRTKDFRRGIEAFEGDGVGALASPVHHSKEHSQIIVLRLFAKGGDRKMIQL